MNRSDFRHTGDTAARKYSVHYTAHFLTRDRTETVNFLKISKYAFAIFALFGILDNISTIILIRHHGIGVEANPLIKTAFSVMSFYCFIPHLLLVLFIAFQLSRPSWNDPKRFMVKSALFYVYIFIVINNWWQVAQIGYQTIVANIIS